jgi:phosphoketolase
MLTAVTKPLSPDLLRRIAASWRAATSLTVGQICLDDIPLLREPLSTTHADHMPEIRGWPWSE